MSSALKPVLSQGGPQNPAPQMNKPLHGQGPTTYGSPSAHMPQNLVAMQHAMPTPAHNSVNVQNHYLNVPNAPYNANISIPASNHPIPSMNQPAAYNMGPTAKNQFPSGFHTPQPAPTPQQAAVPPEAPEKPHSNGTPEAPGGVAGHVADEDHPIAGQKEPEKPKQDKPATPVSSLTDESSDETKQQEESAPDVLDSSSSASIEDMEVNTCNSSTAENKTEEAKVPSESANVTEATAEETKLESIQAVAASSVETATVQSKEQVTAKDAKPSTSRTLTKKVKVPAKADVSDPTKAPKPEKPSVVKSPSRAKRIRTSTQPYQYPLPELEIISKITSSSIRHRLKKDNDEKLIIFYKNEFLAVRNAEGGFYICQAVQNIYRGSSKIKIRWLSQDGEDKTGEVYTPDFYDSTDVDCILTNLELTRTDKKKFRLPAKEKSRTDSILKRALAVEKGETVPPSPTEEHPDGLDLSLYKEESQLQKSPKGKKRKSSEATPSKAKKSPTKKEKKPAVETPKARKAAPSKPSTKTPGKKPSSTRKPPAVASGAPPSARLAANSAVSRSERAKRRQDKKTHEVKTSPVIDAKKAKVLAKVVKTKLTKAVSMLVKKETRTKKEVKPAMPPTKGSKPPPAKRAKLDPPPPERKTGRTRK